MIYTSLMPIQRFKVTQKNAYAQIILQKLKHNALKSTTLQTKKEGFIAKSFLVIHRYKCYYYFTFSTIALKAVLL